MTSIFQGTCVDNDGVVQMLDVGAGQNAPPSGAIPYRGMYINDAGSVYVKVAEGTEDRVFNCGIAFSKEGVLLITSGEPVNPVPGCAGVTAEGYLSVAPFGPSVYLHGTNFADLTIPRTKALTTPA